MFGIGRNEQDKLEGVRQLFASTKGSVILIIMSLIVVDGIGDVAVSCFLCCHMGF
jgi:hypothetical protein